jgi:indole-3-glycerol phosphate synthase
MMRPIIVLGDALSIRAQMREFERMIAENREEIKANVYRSERDRLVAELRRISPNYGAIKHRSQASKRRRAKW